ncbi:Ribose-phosphate pyrophosphokinase [Candidatus Bealeia paramacronuclearis]|uniref:ribose-phosphate diphosphokinase n=1 Tax=Candidatus Bealeia paramacronuclearis TaxID=1921001 RepID=A0ABZ2C6S7_9PROT|nr:Ribose-phosphate pyrophosphokinase [Candidatus Bealeia paramacronuclearis]
MNPIVFQLFEDTGLATMLEQELSLERGKIEIHAFPDEENLIRIESSVNRRKVVFATSLDHPNPKILPLLFAARTARDLGAQNLTLIAPYLPYMRQDKVFQEGEGISSKYFAALLSSHFDHLITIDPHLHRWHSLQDIYTMTTTVLHATKIIAHWIQGNVQSPLILGPDGESTQWVSDVAKIAQAPFLVLEKIRTGDLEVKVSVPDLGSFQNRTPILVDDIISSGKTMIQTLEHLKKIGLPSPICIGIHALFSKSTYEDLLNAGAQRVITCNTIKHFSNGIKINSLFTSHEIP